MGFKNGFSPLHHIVFPDRSRSQRNYRSSFSIILVFCHFPEPPVFKGDYPSNWIEPLGGNAILNCEVKGDPAPTIQWSRRGMDIEISHRIRQLGNGSLAIYGTVVSHSGLVHAYFAMISTSLWCRMFLMHSYFNHKI